MPGQLFDTFSGEQSRLSHFCPSSGIDDPSGGVRVPLLSQQVAGFRDKFVFFGEHRPFLGVSRPSNQVFLLLLCRSKMAFFYRVFSEDASPLVFPFWQVLLLQYVTNTIFWSNSRTGLRSTTWQLLIIWPSVLKMVTYTKQMVSVLALVLVFVHRKCLATSESFFFSSPFSNPALPFLELLQLSVFTTLWPSVYSGLISRVRSKYGCTFGRFFSSHAMAT